MAEPTEAEAKSAREEAAAWDEKAQPDEKVEPETETKTEDATEVKDDETKGEADKTEAKDDEAKEKNRQGYLDRIAQKDDTKEQLEAQATEALAQIEDERDRKIAALEWQTYVDKVERNRMEIAQGAERARSIPLFNPDSPDYNEALHTRALELYARDQIISDDTLKDEKGNPTIVGYKIPIYDYLKDIASVATEGGAVTVKSQEKAEAEMDAKADTTGGTSGTQGKPPKDDFLDGFNSIK